MNSIFHGRLALQQRVLPNYRVPFFELLDSACESGMSLFTGLPRPSEGITVAKKLRVTSHKLGKNIHLFGGNLYLCYQRGLTKWLEDWSPDVVIVEANPRYLSTPPAVSWMHRRDKPVIGWGLGSSPTGGFRRQRRSSFISQFDALIAYSQRGADEYTQLGFPREKIFIAHNSVSLPPASQIPSRPLTLDLRPNILFVGRLQVRKRIDYLLRACAEIKKDLRLVIVGDGPERESLESLATEIYPSAEFVGSKYGADLEPYFTEADLFILPGTGGLAAQEAMSYGLPVIVAQGDGTQEDLVRKGNGWQIPPHDLDALLFAIKDALSDVARLRRMGEESYRIVRDEINIEKMVEAFVRALNSVSRK